MLTLPSVFPLPAAAGTLPAVRRARGESRGEVLFRHMLQFYSRDQLVSIVPCVIRYSTAADEDNQSSMADARALLDGKNNLT